MDVEKSNQIEFGPNTDYSFSQIKKDDIRGTNSSKTNEFDWKIHSLIFKDSPSGRLIKWAKFTCSSFKALSPNFCQKIYLQIFAKGVTNRIIKVRFSNFSSFRNLKSLQFRQKMCCCIINVLKYLFACHWACIKEHFLCIKVLKEVFAYHWACRKEHFLWCWTI